MYGERTRRTRIWLENAPPIGGPQERQPLTSVPHEQVELAKALYKLSVLLPGFVARVVPGYVTTTQWLTLANALAAIAEQCRRQVPREVLDIGDSGGR